MLYLNDIRHGKSDFILLIFAKRVHSKNRTAWHGMIVHRRQFTLVYDILFRHIGAKRCIFIQSLSLTSVRFSMHDLFLGMEKVGGRPCLE